MQHIEWAGWVDLKMVCYITNVTILNNLGEKKKAFFYDEKVRDGVTEMKQVLEKTCIKVHMSTIFNYRVISCILLWINFTISIFKWFSYCRWSWWEDDGSYVTVNI